MPQLGEGVGFCSFDFVVVVVAECDEVGCCVCAAVFACVDVVDGEALDAGAKHALVVVAVEDAVSQVAPLSGVVIGAVLVVLLCALMGVCVAALALVAGGRSAVEAGPWWGRQAGGGYRIRLHGSNPPVRSSLRCWYATRSCAVALLFGRPRSQGSMQAS